MLIAKLITTHQFTMRGLRKKMNNKKIISNIDNLVRDITIDEFANNNSQICARLKKSLLQDISKVKHKVMLQEKTEWDIDEEILEDDTKENHRAIFITNRKKKKKPALQDNIGHNEEINYPVDVWFSISEYITPETVGKFARICKNSYYVTTTGKFWNHLYKSYFKHVPNMPLCLQPSWMTIYYELRARIIRALYYDYFKRLQKNNMYLQHNLHSLIKMKCTQMWHIEEENRCYFYLKLRDTSKTNLLSNNKQCNTENKEYLKMLNDIAINSEEGCKILKVTCLTYSMFPPILGLILQTVSLLSTSRYQESKLQLEFGTSETLSSLTTRITLLHVIEWCILDWWDPAYPYDNESYLKKLLENASWD